MQKRGKGSKLFDDHSARARGRWRRGIDKEGAVEHSKPCSDSALVQLNRLGPQQRAANTIHHNVLAVSGEEERKKRESVIGEENTVY
jgi:hypothetical protein